MAASARPYALASQHLGRARADLLTAGVKLALAGAGYTPGDDHAWFSDVYAQVVSSSYTPGGQTLTGRTFEYEPDLDATVLRCDPPTWPVTGFSWRYAICYAALATPGTSPLLSYVDMGEAIAQTGPLTLTFTDGVYRLGRP